MNVLKTTLKIALIASTVLGIGCGNYPSGNGEANANANANDDLCAGSSPGTARQCEFLTVNGSMCPVDPLYRRDSRMADSVNAFRQCINEGQDQGGGFRTLGVDRFHEFAVEVVSNNQIVNRRITVPVGDFNNNGVLDDVECFDALFGLETLVRADDLGPLASSVCQ